MTAFLAVAAVAIGLLWLVIALALIAPTERT